MVSPFAAGRRTVFVVEGTLREYPLILLKQSCSGVQKNRAADRPSNTVYCIMKKGQAIPPVNRATNGFLTAIEHLRVLHSNKTFLGSSLNSVRRSG